MITRIEPPIAVLTPKGKALAYFLIDYSYDHNLTWVCFMDKTGECWSFQNPDIRVQKNITHGRDYISPFYDPNAVALKTQ